MKIVADPLPSYNEMDTDEWMNPIRYRPVGMDK